jgi:DNA-directed RNA polymerase subunit beta
VVEGRQEDDRARLRKLAETASRRCGAAEELIGRYIRARHGQPETGEIYAEAGDELTEKPIARTALEPASTRSPCSTSTTSMSALHPQHAGGRQEPSREALIDIYRVMRPGEPPTLDTAEALFKGCSSTPSATTCRRSAA